MIKVRIPISACLCLLLISVPGNSEETRDGVWEYLGEGLELGKFPTRTRGFGGDETVVVLRADPEKWSLDLISSSRANYGRNLTSREWSEQFNLAAVINGGMFHKDGLTHVGYCLANGQENNSGINHYESVAAFCPNKTDIPSFRMFDLDEDVSISGIKENYGCAVQNLRLIKRSGENRWQAQDKRWSEAALGEDAEGRILFIFCRTGYSMNDLNEILLRLPIDLVCAHHLEGGPEAQLYIKIDDREFEFVGSYETDFNENDDWDTLTRIPVIIGLKAVEERAE